MNKDDSDNPNEDLVSLSSAKFLLELTGLVSSGLEQLRTDNRLDELERFAASDSFNLFRAMNAADYELRHSDLLAFLFRSDEKHHLGLLFYELFCSAFGVSLKNDPDIEVYREYANIDILVIDRANSTVLVIENKIWTGEHDNQLVRYRKFTEKEFDNFTNRKYFYLTMVNEAPSNSAWQGINYGQISDIIIKILKKRNLAPDLRVVLRHYREILTTASMTEKETKLCDTIFEKHSNALRLLVRHSMSREIEAAVLKSLMDMTEKPKVLWSENRGKQALIQFQTAGEFTDPFYFEFQNNGQSASTNLALYFYAKDDPSKVERWREFARKHLDVFNTAKKESKIWYGCYRKVMIPSRVDMGEPERIQMLTKAWREFLSVDYPKMVKLLRQFEKEEQKK